MAIQLQPAKERACKVQSLVRFALCSIHGVRSTATLKGISYLTTLQSDLSNCAMLLGLPKYALGYANHNRASAVHPGSRFYRLPGKVEKALHDTGKAALWCGSISKASSHIAKGDRVAECANTGNLDNGQG